MHETQLKKPCSSSQARHQRSFYMCVCTASRHPHPPTERVLSSLAQRAPHTHHCLFISLTFSVCVSLSVLLFCLFRVLHRCDALLCKAKVLLIMGTGIAAAIEQLDNFVTKYGPTAAVWQMLGSVLRCTACTRVVDFFFFCDADFDAWIGLSVSLSVCCCIRMPPSLDRKCHLEMETPVEAYKALRKAAALIDRDPRHPSKASIEADLSEALRLMNAE